ncbi:hypothetical protein [Alicyclobacillus dauci]|uniref:Uncharacterized protein n=1 Tax=Alicyclobacillus dauci TaxID=1475485 RepID=A0ABY6Z637_9BACL|nr:hypothetical protein [Alicyclobacillus dauci]WAH38229.1 hypothetical protein NZD86_07040 [Alicyclobacillus dauci]
MNQLNQLNSTTYLILGIKGNVKMATNLEEVWTFASQLIHGEIDVLDPSF